MLTNSNFYIGDSSVSRLYQGENLIWDASRPDILLSYIENGQAATRPNVYFDTGVYPDSSTDVEISYQLSGWPVSGANDSAFIFGCTQTTSSYSYAGDYYIGAPFLIDGTFYACRFRNQSALLCEATPDSSKHIIRTVNTASMQTLYYDDSSVSAAPTSVRTKEITAYIFSRRYNDSISLTSYKGTRIYYVKIWQSNNLIRFYIPVLHWNNGQYVPCFYDKVNDTYIYNLGTDAPTYKISGDYLLNYIQCGNDYLDQSTGARCSIRYNPQLPVDLGYEFHMKVNPGNAYYNNPPTPQESFIIGERVSGTGKIGFYMPNASYGIRTAWLSAVSTLWSGNPAGIDFRISWTINQSDRKRSAWVNDSSVQSAGTEASSVPEELVGANIYINKCGAANVWSGNKYYYIIIDKFTINQRTYIPVLHNGQAMFLDLSNSTYMQHTVDGGSGTDNTLIYSF